MKPDRIIERIAARQHGVFSRSQAVRAGFSPKMMETRLSTGAWLRLAASVYTLPSAPGTWERQMSAGLLGHPRSIAAGASAAYLHEFDGSRPGRPVVMTGPFENARSKLARVIRTRHFADVESTVIKGFDATTIPETLITLAASTPADPMAATLDSLLAARRLQIDDLTELLVRRRGLPGIVMIRDLAMERSADAYQPPMSELERLLFRLLDNRGIPSVVRQMPFAFETTDVTVDAYIPRWRLIIEADGRRWHTRMADFEKDHRRDNAAVSHGYAVLRFTYRMLTCRPEVCLDTLLRTGTVRSAS